LEAPVAEQEEALGVVRAFGVAAAKDATLRMLDFSWRDLAGVSVALAHRSLRLPEALTFLTLLVGHAAACCSELTPQMMLNIAQSAVRVHVRPEKMQAMVDGIAAALACGRLHFNEVDQRQWMEVQEYCVPRLPPHMMHVWG